GEVVDIQTAEICLQSQIDVVECNLLRLELLAIDLDEELRLIDRKTAEQADQPRVGVSAIGQILNRSLQGPQARAAQVLHLHLETACRSQAVDRRRAKDGDPR